MRSLRRMPLLASVAIVTALVGTVAVTGCSSTAGTKHSSAPTASATPSPAPSTTSSVLTGLSFEQGNSLDTSVADAPTFANLFEDSNDWSATDQTDASKGFWQYATSDGTCVVSLSQIVIGDKFTITPDDDRATSTAALAWFYRDAPVIADQVAANAIDETLPFGIGWTTGDPGTDFRGIAAQGDDGQIISGYARAFGKPGVALYLELTCSSTDAYGAHSEDALLNGTVQSG